MKTLPITSLLLLCLTSVMPCRADLPKPTTDLPRIAPPSNRKAASPLWMAPLEIQLSEDIKKPVGARPAQRREAMTTVRIYFEGALKSGTFTEAQITNWTKIAAKGEVEAGMPALLAEWSWGKPARVNSSATAPEQWVYYSEGIPRDYLYIKDGFVANWQVSR